MNLVQIGAGSGNLDKNIEDGFTNFIEKKKIKGKIFFVDANSLHLNNLKKYWKKNRDVKIFNLGITSDNSQKRELTFFYSEDDKPDFQLFSSSFNFVKKHYPNSKILSKEVKCLNISTFLKKNNLYSVNFLSLDIEGMDFEVIHNLDFRRFDIKNLSFEHLNLTIWQKFKIVFKLIKNGYFFSGMGFDTRKSDWMFSKQYKSKLLTTILLPITPRRIWKHYNFSDFIR